jgi:alkylation response protein AidB-like acyl-CoA dehydrogenase
VKLPEGIKKSFRAFQENEWEKLELPESMGGYGAPPSLVWSAMELCIGANPVTAFYQFGTFCARIINELGTDAQKKRYVKPMLEKHWGGTMQLSEPQAGSDVGEGRTKAKHIKDDVWELNGTKAWITSGDFDAVENIVHLVLARPEGHGAGTKGLSLFIVPKFWVNEDGSMGERNGIYARSIEKKMGIKASATCVMNMGDEKPCRGLLVGEVHDGIRQMFKVIEQARMSIGMKSMATLSTAYLNALSYAKDRVQGPDLAKAMDKTSPRVRIINHPDVRRMLMQLKSHAEGMRALCLYDAHIQDQVELKGGHKAGAAGELDKLNDLLLPLVKGYCSDKTFELLGVALQVFGGTGYTQDWPMEQYIRDQKIDTLYEGTTHIQAQDLIFRKIAKDGGATLQVLMGDVVKTLETKEGGPALAAEREALKKALENLQTIFGVLMPKMQESVYHVGLHANRILYGLAEVTIGWLLIRHAAVAVRKLSEVKDASDKAFYEGKVASARYFAAEVLPNLATSRRIIEASTLGLMELSEEAFG